MCIYNFWKLQLFRDFCNFNTIKKSRCLKLETALPQPLSLPNFKSILKGNDAKTPVKHIIFCLSLIFKNN